MKRRLLIGSIVSLAFLYLALRGTDWAEFLAVFKKTRHLYVFLSVFFTILGLYFRAFRWRFLLAPLKPLGMGCLFSATSIGFMANNLLPARLGEVVRAYVLGKSESISKSATFATIVCERIVDVFAVLMLLWLTLHRASGPSWLRRSGILVLAMNVVFLAALFTMQRGRHRVASIVEKATHPLPMKARDRIRDTTDRFLDGLKILSEGKAILPVVAVSAPVWYAAVLTIYFCTKALEMQLPQMAAVTLAVFLALGSMIPSAPAYLGTTQYACVIGLAIYAVGRSEALAYSILYHATQFFPITLLGLYYLWRSHLRFKEIAQTG